MHQRILIIEIQNTIDMCFKHVFETYNRFASRTIVTAEQALGASFHSGVLLLPMHGIA